MIMDLGGDDLQDDLFIDESIAEEEVESSPLVPGISQDSEESEDDRVALSESLLLAKKRKLKAKDKERKAKKRKLAETIIPEECSIASQGPSELSNYLASMQVKSFPKVSVIELADLQIPESAIVDTTLWTGPRTLDQLVSFIMKMLPSLHTRLTQKSKSNGAPTLLYIASAALRVADVTRILKDKKLRGEKGGDVAKLFAKHFKLAQHVTYLKRTKIGSAVGTPGRLGKLLNEENALNVSALSHIILDITFKDTTTRNLLDIPETRDEIFGTILNHVQILKGIKEGKIQVVLF